MTTVLGQLMTWSTLGTGTGRIWLYDRSHAAARPSDQRSRLHSHLAGPCDRRRKQQSDGRRHSMPGLGVGDQPRDGSDNPRMADSVYRSNYAVWHAGHYEHLMVRPDAGRIQAAYAGQCIWGHLPGSDMARRPVELQSRPCWGSALQRALLAQIIAWSSIIRTAVIHRAAANYVGPQPVDGRLPDATWRQARMVAPNLLGCTFI